MSGLCRVIRTRRIILRLVSELRSRVSSRSSSIRLVFSNNIFEQLCSEFQHPAVDSAVRPTWRTVDQWFAASVVSTYRSLHHGRHGRLLFPVVLVIIIATVVIIVAAGRERFGVRCRGQSVDKADMCLLCICGCTRGGRQRSAKLSPVCPSVLHHSRARGVECRFCDMICSGSDTRFSERLTVHSRTT